MCVSMCPYAPTIDALTTVERVTSGTYLSAASVAAHSALILYGDIDRYRHLFSASTDDVDP